MKLGFMVYSLGRTISEGRLSLAEAFELMRECGAEGVDVSDWNVQGQSIADVARMVAEAGLAVSSYISGANLCIGPGQERQAAIDKLKMRLDDAAELGAKTVLFTTGAAAPGQDRKEARRNVAEGLAELLPLARERGIVLTIEDFGSTLSPHQTSGECLEVCELAGPELRLTYDTGNMIMGEEDPVDFLRKTAHLIVHAHAKDWELLPADHEGPAVVSRSGKKYRGTVVGQGVLDYPAIIAALKAIGYEGYISFEYEGPGDQVEAARQGCAYLLKLMGSALE
ncbi:MAG: sugar phosphate isomerase/epimerase [Armatimonadetes bacterium]|nr:sugar phosphate isomerase/epimerase [Armatimonadota bacterium]